MKSTDKSSSTSSLYEFADELAAFNKSGTKQKNAENTAATANSAFTYSMEVPTNAHGHNQSSDIYDVVD